MDMNIREPNNPTDTHLRGESTSLERDDAVRGALPLPHSALPAIELAMPATVCAYPDVGGFASNTTSQIHGAHTVM